MRLPLQLTFRNVEPTDHMHRLVRENTSKLDQYFDHITSCRVVVEIPHRRHRHGNCYQVSIDMTVPGSVIVVNKESAADTAHEAVDAAIRDSFDQARRQLEDYARKLRGQTKVHEETSRGPISRLFADEGFGFIESADGRDIYFHRNDLVKGSFDRLSVGTTVRYVERETEKGTRGVIVRPCNGQSAETMEAAP